MSWHSLTELSRCLPLVQTYIERLSRSSSLLPVNRKRKARDLEDDHAKSRDSKLGTLTPEDTPGLSSRAASAVSDDVSKNDCAQEDEVYNGILERKEGRIVVKRSSSRSANHVVLPTEDLIAESARTPTTQASRAIRQAFYNKLQRLPSLSLENKIDNSTPSLDFRFINEYVFGKDVSRPDPDALEGCQKPCRPNMGQNIGCEHPRECSCLEYAAVDETVLRREEPERYETYKRQKDAGEYIDKSDLPKRFPYHRSKGDGVPQTLQIFYRDQRHPIYECNPRCKCGPGCKTRLVQKGRRVPLTIFKTPNRGWGVKCGEDLIAGEFIDTYLGEIITNEEADLRESQGGKDRVSYLYSLDKFIGDDPELTADNCYVVDGQHVGGATRFINHSCEPNCRQYTVSYNKNDSRVYDLAFFAIEDIPAGTELTFDYMDKDEEEEDHVIRKREAAGFDPRNSDRVPCRCGARKCRGYMWDD